jgi:hypothetical protein
MPQEYEGRNDAAIKQTAAEAVSEVYERHPDALGGATAAALRSAEQARSCQLRCRLERPGCKAAYGESDSWCASPHRSQ